MWSSFISFQSLIFKNRAQIRLLVALFHEGGADGLAEGGGLYQPHAVRSGVLRAVLRYDARGETEPGGLLHAALHLGGGAELPTEAHLADGGGVGGDLFVLEARGDGEGRAGVGGGLAHLEAAGDVDEDVLVAEFDADALGEDSYDEEQAVVIHAVGGAAGHAEGGRGGEGLDFDEQRAGALDS